MTTLAADAIRVTEIGDIQEYPVIAADIIYQGATVGLVDASGHARPLTSADRFAGFAELRVDNAAGAAAAKKVRTIARGKAKLTISGVEIQDQAAQSPVYASDDDTFSLNPADGQFIGFVSRFIDTDLALVTFDAERMKDPWAAYSTRETLTGIKTFDAEDCGKLFCVTAAGDADALTLPAIAAGLSGLAILAVGGFGTTAVTIDPAAADMILGPDITGADNKDLICTKATQRRGDFVELIAGDADGYMVVKKRGIWAREA